MVRLGAGWEAEVEEEEEEKEEKEEEKGGEGVGRPALPAAATCVLGKGQVAGKGSRNRPRPPLGALGS